MLTSLRLYSCARKIWVLPNSFMGGSCPCLQDLHLDGIPFLGLGKLLLSTSDLIDLCLEEIPHSGYIAPEAMIIYLSGLTKLQSFELGFRSLQSQAKQASRHPPTMTHIVLSALTRFWFQGDSMYLEEIMSQIDTPLLETFTITLFDSLVLNTPQLCHFISHTKTFTALHQADIICHGVYSDISVTFFLLDGPGSTNRRVLMLGVQYTPSGPRFTSLVWLCSSSLPPLPTLEHLSTQHYLSSCPPCISVTEWVELLCVFSFVKDLRLSRKLSYSVFPALRELAGEGVIEVLPALQNIFVHSTIWASDYFMKDIELFVTTRQLSGHPVAIHRLE